MENRKLGNLIVSPIGMGCMGFSHGYGNVPEEAYAIDAIRHAYEIGCTFFDTAESYGKEMFEAGHNERLVGKAIEPFRKNITLATKYHLNTEEVNAIGLETYIRQHLEQSCKNLRTDYIDLYYLHRINTAFAIEDIAVIMGKLINEGKIKGWGLSQVDRATLQKAHEITPVTAVQNLYNMLERDDEAELLPYCLENNIGYVPFSPIASGFLSGKVTSETKFEGDDVRKFVPQLSQENITKNQPILEIIQTYAHAKNATNAQISIAWMCKKYPNLVPIPGSKNKERIIENLTAWDVELTDEEFTSLENALNNTQVYGHRGSVENEKTKLKNWKKA